ncbi:hypothetical protein Q3C01_34395 [Bradyrhizobium sp. UFLA05-109]
MTGVNLNGRGSRGPAGLLPLGEGVDVVVTARDDSKARPAGGGRQIPAHLSHHRLARGADENADLAISMRTTGPPP